MAKKEKEFNVILTRELWGMVLTFFSLISLFCLITGDAVFYSLGTAVQKFLLGVFGFVSYPLFIATTLFGILLIFGKKTEKDNKALAVSLFVCVFALVCILHSALKIPKVHELTFGEYLSDCYNSPEANISKSSFGGASIGIVVYLLAKIASIYGAFIIYALLLIIGFLVVYKKRGDFGKKKEENTDVVEETNSAPVEKIEKSEPVKKGGLFVDKNDFAFKGARDEEFPSKSGYNGYNRESSYSDEYQKEFKTKMDFIKTPQKLTPEDVSNAINGRKDFKSIDDKYTFAEDGYDDMYVPGSYKDAVKSIDDVEEYDGGTISGKSIFDNDSDNDIISDERSGERFEEPVEDYEEDVVVVEEEPDEELEEKVEYVNPPKQKHEDYSSAYGQTSVFSEQKEYNPFDEMPLDFKYKAPPTELLNKYEASHEDQDKLETFKQDKAEKIVNTLKVLGGVQVEVANIIHGPTITRFDISIPDDVSIKTVMKYTDDLKLRLQVKEEIRFRTIPGTSLIGIEVPNDVKSIVGLRSVIESQEFINAKRNSLTFAVGQDIVGNSVVADISKMPHLLVAGSTGTGKSVGLNTLIVSLMYRYSPSELRFIIVDPKQVEFTVFNGIPHMMFDEIICETPKAIAMLNWAIKEMESRYLRLKNAIVHNIDEYNEQVDTRKERIMPRIVIIIDEFADLMSTDKRAIEDRIQRLAQKARAAGIYLIMATQRPSVNIVEGSIKTNFTSRFAFKMSNGIDSNTILGEQGAEKLLGNGDLLYKTSTMTSVERAQGAFINMTEIKNVVRYVKENNVSYFNESALKSINEELNPQIESVNGKDEDMGEDGIMTADQLAVLRLAVKLGVISISLIQRKLSYGFPKAAKMFDWLENEGYVSQTQIGKQRQVILTKEEFEQQFGAL